MSDIQTYSREDPFEVVYQETVVPARSKIVFLVMDGLGGIPGTPDGGSELQASHHPNLDRLVSQGCAGLLDPVIPGVTPGSGPGHLALFGYDPLVYSIGRGALSAAGVGFDLSPDDVAARANLCTLAPDGTIADRRAGRISTAETAQILKELSESVAVPGAQCFLVPEKDHRALLVLRGEGLSDRVTDTDPQRTGVPPRDPEPRPDAGDDPTAKRTAELLSKCLAQIREALAGRDRANFLLLRGFARRPRLPAFGERYSMSALAIAQYPMYLGLARLLGMNDNGPADSLESQIDTLRNHFEEYDFFYFHFKATDTAGEDGAFDRKCAAIEEVDSVVVPAIEALSPQVLVVTGDHSTPAQLRGHSWHPVPVLLWGPRVPRDDVDRFDEVSAARGWIGRRRAVELFPLVLAAAERTRKFGA